MSHSDTIVKAKNLDEVSFPDLKYPSLRDAYIKSPYVWLTGKAMDDGAEGLWRIHDKLYDFEKFVDKHPGGKNWLTLTKGTDITEAFESHHISTFPERMIEAYYVRTAAVKRNSPFTFEEHGLFRTLKRRIRQELPKVPDDAANASKRIMEVLALGLLVLSTLACHAPWGWQRYLLCLMAAISLTWTTTCSHNFIHQRDNWRMYIFNFCLGTTREFRIIHILSHHPFPNTLLDMEMTVLEPFFQWLPRKSKSIWARFGGILHGFILFPIFFDFSLLYRIVAYFKFKNYKIFDKEDFVPLLMPLTMYIFGRCSLKDTLITWMIITHLGAFITVMVTVHSAHHHPDMFHDGDSPAESTDWGAHQIFAVADRVEIEGSLFRVLTNYGDHVMHHMFPTIDHAVLMRLHPVFVEVCAQFGQKPRVSTIADMFLGSFEQMARTECKRREP